MAPLLAVLLLASSSEALWAPSGLGDSSYARTPFDLTVPADPIGLRLHYSMAAAIRTSTAPTPHRGPLFDVAFAALRRTR